jgi:hypothetical protein
VVVVDKLNLILGIAIEKLAVIPVAFMPTLNETSGRVADVLLIHPSKPLTPVPRFVNVSNPSQSQSPAASEMLVISVAVLETIVTADANGIILETYCPRCPALALSFVVVQVIAAEVGLFSIF